MHVALHLPENTYVMKFKIKDKNRKETDGVLVSGVSPSTGNAMLEESLYFLSS